MRVHGFITWSYFDATSAEGEILAPVMKKKVYFRVSRRSVCEQLSRVIYNKDGIGVEGDFIDTMDAKGNDLKYLAINKVIG